MRKAVTVAPKTLKPSKLSIFLLRCYVTNQKLKKGYILVPLRQPFLPLYHL